MSKPSTPRATLHSPSPTHPHLPRVECLLDERKDVLLARRAVLFLGLVPAVLADDELELELPARDLEERVAQQALVLRLLGEPQVERRVRRELERQRVVGQRGGVGLAEHRRGRDRAPLDRRQHRALPRLLQLLELERRRFGRAQASLQGQTPSGGLSLGSGGRGGPRCSSSSRRYAIDSAESSDARPRHLDERQLERQARVGALAHVLDGDGEQVAAAGARSPPAIWFACARSRSRVSSVTGQRVGHLAEVVDEHQVPQVLEQVGDDAAEVLPLLGELLDERSSAPAVSRSTIRSQSRKSASSSTAPSVWRTSCTVIVPLGGGGELVERRLGVAVGAACARARSARARRRGRRSPRRPRSGAAS